MDVTFLGLSELDSLARDPVTNRHTLMLSTFCFLLYFREAAHKSSILNTRDTALSHEEVVISPQGLPGSTNKQNGVLEVFTWQNAAGARGRRK